jgi:hypothetical protein
MNISKQSVSFAMQKGLAFQLTSTPAFIPTGIEGVFDIT